MTRPWFQFYSRDWLDNKELRRCSAEARSILSDLMCLAHEGTPYGYLRDQIGPLTDQYMASRCVVSVGRFRAAVESLKAAGRLSSDDTGIFISRMVEDERIRLSRASGGVLGGNPALRPKINGKVNLPDNLMLEGKVRGDSRARMRADSDFDSGYGFSGKKKNGDEKIPEDTETRIRQLANDQPNPQDFEPGINRAVQEVLSSANPLITLASMEENLPHWWAAMREGRVRSKPLGYVITDGDYLRKPPSNKRRNGTQSLNEMLDEILAEDEQKKRGVA